MYSGILATVHIVGVCGHCYSQLSDQSALMDIGICQAVMRSDQADGVTGTAAKSPKCPILINTPADSQKEGV